ncbi:hypothetical protein Afer_1251 [Acidimicrobium ferrooxidans DSM 10331]|uniref:Uncharacterized protein n=1 Tax=Acidimicrobium ferrooxidans (strain DSM 10331 / JCM 15462 / NBRC 103882 / ICP) TaxID=525909 RepID=C7LZM4_ACIFD|nr:hypothetical protein [Acidimicrobium ferrooxidans]ACU54182.1 hypothetical protein Afer_1251 [Acidimicrobium ferrooxidans DSM 10331]
MARAALAEALPRRSGLRSPELRVLTRAPRRRSVPWRVLVIGVVVVAALGVIAARLVAQRLANTVQATELALQAAEVHHLDLVAELSTLSAPSHAAAVAAAHGFVHPTWEELASGRGAPVPTTALGQPTGESAPLPAGTVARG